MPGAASGIPGLMAEYLFKTSCILVLALLAAAAAKKRAAAVRHFILSSALIGLLFLPLVTLVPVRWRSPLLPGWMGPAEERTTAAGPAGAAIDPAVAGFHAPPIAAESAEAGRPAESSPAARIAATAAPARPSGGPLRAGASGPGAADLAPGRAGDGPDASAARDHRAGSSAAGSVLALLWASGLATLLLRLAFGLAGAVRLTAEGRPLADASWRALLARFVDFVSLRRGVRLKGHPEVLVPLTWGWRRPVVLLPDGADAWTDDERSSALYHELAHVKRADFLVMLLVRASLALFWWNPLCWIVYRELLKEQEIACDELVLRAGIRPSTYAATLLAFRRSAGFRWNPSAALLGLFGRSSFQERLAAILKQKMILMEVKMKTKIMLALALVGAVALVGTAGPAAARAAQAEETVLVETPLPPAAALGAALEAQAPSASAPASGQEKALAQEKAQEAKKAKEAEKTIVVVGKDGGKSPIEIVITEGDTVKKLIAEKSLTITKGKGGEIVLNIGDKEPLVLEGEPLRLEIKGGQVQVIEEGRAVKEIGGSGLTLVFTPRERGKGFTLIKPGEAVPGGATVVVERHGQGEPAVGWTVKEGEKDRSLWVAKEFAGKEGSLTWVGEDGRAFAFSKARDEEMLANVKELQKQVEAIKAKKLDLAALEESLKKLEAELQANEGKLRALRLKFEGEGAAFSRVEKMLGDKDFNVYYHEKDKTGEAGSRVRIISKDKGEGGLTIVLSEEGLGREAYERALARLKKDLPEGYKIAESEFEEEGPSMTFRLTPPEGKAVDKDVVKRLVELLQAEIKK